MPATPRSATRWRGCSRSPGMTSNASTTSTTPAGRWTASARRWRRGTSSALGREAEVPEDGYHGDYIAELAARRSLRRTGARSRRPAAGGAVRRGFARRARVARWSGSARRSSGSGSRSTRTSSRRRSSRRARSPQAIDRLREAGYVYEAEGATWFRSTEFGDDKDRVVIRSNGTHTYFAADMRVRRRQVRARRSTT